MDQKSLLIVDDEKEICEIIAFRMEEEGYTTHMAFNGQEALELLKQQKVDAVISDIRMPLMDGIALLKRLNSDFSAPPPMILLSGFSDVTEEEAKKFGAFLFLNKPMEMSELVNAVSLALVKAD